MMLALIALPVLAVLGAWGVIANNIGVSRVSALFYLVPPLAALFAWPMLGELMPPLGWAGIALAAVGVALASRRKG